MTVSSWFWPPSSLILLSPCTSGGWGGLLLEIGGVLPTSLNPYLFLDQDMRFQTWPLKNSPFSSQNGKNRYPIWDRGVKHTQFETKMFKIYTSFQTKTAQKPYPLGQHIPISIIKGRSTPPPPPPPPRMYILLLKEFLFIFCLLRRKKTERNYLVQIKGTRICFNVKVFNLKTMSSVPSRRQDFPISWHLLPWLENEEML